MNVIFFRSVQRIKPNFYPCFSNARDDAEASTPVNAFAFLRLLATQAHASTCADACLLSRFVEGKFCGNYILLASSYALEELLVGKVLLKGKNGALQKKASVHFLGNNFVHCFWGAIFFRTF